MTFYDIPTNNDSYEIKNQKFSNLLKLHRDDASGVFMETLDDNFNNLFDKATMLVWENDELILALHFTFGRPFLDAIMTWDDIINYLE